MRLYGHAMSLMTWQVLLTLAEKGLTASEVSIDVRSTEQRKPPHLRRHPFGHIPVLEDDDFVVYETDAILRYLDERDASPTLSQRSPRGRAIQDQWLCVLDAYLYPAVKEVTARQYAVLVGDADPGDAGIERGRRDLARTLAIFRAHMTGRVWVADEGYGLADIRWATFLDELGRMMPDEVDDVLRNLTEWLDRVRQRPAWKTAAQSRERFGNPERW